MTEQAKGAVVAQVPASQRRGWADRGGPLWAPESMRNQLAKRGGRQVAIVVAGAVALLAVLGGGIFWWMQHYAPTEAPVEGPIRSPGGRTM